MNFHWSYVFVLCLRVRAREISTPGADIAVPHCVMTQDPSVTYDLNSWQETPHSRAKVAELPVAMPIFEGYDDDVGDVFGQPQEFVVHARMCIANKCV